MCSGTTEHICNAALHPLNDQTETVKRIHIKGTLALYLVIYDKIESKQKTKIVTKSNGPITAKTNNKSTN